MNGEVKRYLDSYKILLVKNIQAIIFNELKLMENVIETQISLVSIDSAEEAKTLTINTFENEALHALKA